MYAHSLLLLIRTRFSVSYIHSSSNQEDILESESAKEKVVELVGETPCSQLGHAQRTVKCAFVLRGTVQSLGPRGTHEVVFCLRHKVSQNPPRPGYTHYAASALGVRPGGLSGFQPSFG